jgi:tRNA (guanine37-N1)-methyltransferase
MHIDILTLFPDMFTSYTNESILKRAQEAGHLTLRWHNIRDYATDKHRVTDEPPYGGGGGMILKPEPIFRAVDAVLQASRGAGEQGGNSPPLILMSPQGRPFTQKVAQELAQHEQLILICGRYDGVDERVRQHLITDEISIGDYVLTGGELAAMVIIDAVARLRPGVLGAEGAAETDSFATGLLEGPHYTRPETFRDWSVPEVLRSGHAANIARWRREQALRRTWQRRPELLETAVLTEEDKWFLLTLAQEELNADKQQSPPAAAQKPESLQPDQPDANQ